MFEKVFSLVLIISVLSVLFFYFFIKKREGKDWVYAIYFLTVLIFGTILFSLALFYKKDSDTSFSFLFVLAKAIGLSLKTFGGDFSSSVLSSLAKDNSFILVASFVHFIAAISLTFLIAIKLFGKNLINKMAVFLNSFKSKYIVVGLSKESEIFINSLKAKKRITVILEPNQKARKKELMFLGLKIVVIDDDAEHKNIENNLYKALLTAGFKRNKRETKIISMSSEDEINLNTAKIITDYIFNLIKPTKENGRISKLSENQQEILSKIKLSSHIMYSSLEKSQHYSFSEYALGRVKFFNPYEVRARKFLIENPITSLIPSSFIDTKRARLNKDYKIGNIFVGCGNTNLHLIKKSICSNQLLGIDYNALIIDKSATSMQKRFKNDCIGLFTPTLEKDKEYFESPKEKYNIDFVDSDVLSLDFYNTIIEEIGGSENKKACDYVSIIIALGDDRLSIETALEIRQKLYERDLLKTKESDRVKIFVKIDKESVLTNQNLLNDKNGIQSQITVFGATHEILNEKYIINEQLDSIAKSIANNYSKTAKDSSNIVTNWDLLTEFKRDSNRFSAMSIESKLNLLGFKLIANGKTDEKTANEYERAYGLDVASSQRSLKETGKFVDFLECDKDGNIIDNARNNLARNEHQRWNTVHLVSGWTQLSKDKVCLNIRQDEKSKKHACISTFEGLIELRNKQAELAVLNAKEAGEELSLDKALIDADTICYDFDVMDNLLLHLDALNLKIIKARQ